jgi:hypothetical protein
MITSRTNRSSKTIGKYVPPEVCELLVNSLQGHGESCRVWRGVVSAPQRDRANAEETARQTDSLMKEVESCQNDGVLKGGGWKEG